MEGLVDRPGPQGSRSGEGACSRCSSSTCSSPLNSICNSASSNEISSKHTNTPILTHTLSRRCMPSLPMSIGGTESRIQSFLSAESLKKSPANMRAYTNCLDSSRAHTLEDHVEILGSFVFMRHGARTPKERFMTKSGVSTAADIMPSPSINSSVSNIHKMTLTKGDDGEADTGKSCENSDWPFSGPPGSLTVSGWAQAVRVGDALRKSHALLGGRPCSPYYSMPVLLCSTESLRCIQTAQGLLEGLSKRPHVPERASSPQEYTPLEARDVVVRMDDMQTHAPTSSSANSRAVSFSVTETFPPTLPATPTECVSVMDQQCSESTGCIYTATAGSPLAGALKAKSSLVKLLKQRALRTSARYADACVRFSLEADLLRRVTGWSDKRDLKVLKKFVSSYGAYIYHGIPLPALEGPFDLYPTLLSENSSSDYVQEHEFKDIASSASDECGSQRRITSRSLLEAVFAGADLVTRVQFTADPLVGWRAGGTSLMEITAKLEKIADFHLRYENENSHEPNDSADNCPEVLCIFVSHQSALLALQAALGIESDELHVPKFGCFLQAELVRLLPARAHANAPLSSEDDQQISRISSTNSSAYENTATSSASICVLEDPNIGGLGDHIEFEELEIIDPVAAAPADETVDVSLSSAGSDANSTSCKCLRNARKCACARECPSVCTSPLVDLTPLKLAAQRIIHPNILVRWWINGEVPLILPPRLRGRTNFAAQGVHAHASFRHPQTGREEHKMSSPDIFPRVCTSSNPDPIAEASVETREAPAVSACSSCDSKSSGPCVPGPFFCLHCIRSKAQTAALNSPANISSPFRYVSSMCTDTATTCDADANVVPLDVLLQFLDERVRDYGLPLPEGEDLQRQIDEVTAELNVMEGSGKSKIKCAV